MRIEIKKTVYLVMFLMLALTLPASARDYTLDHASANIIIGPDGITHVEESITYLFDGTFKEVYRNVYKPHGGNITNISGHIIGHPTEFSVLPIIGGYELVCQLPSPTPSTVTFVVSYEYHGGVKVYNDVSELHYKLWGDEWEKGMHSLSASVTIPRTSEKDIRFWIHPDQYTTSAYIDNMVAENTTTLWIEAGDIPMNQWYELRMSFPRLDDPNPAFVSIQEMDGMPGILDIEKTYSQKLYIIKILLGLTKLCGIVVLLFPLGIYVKYGREPKIEYHGTYEREAPTKTKPALINAFMVGNIGTPTMEAFTATIMDLVYREYLHLEESVYVKKSLGIITKEKKDIIIRINSNKDKSILLDYEQDILKMLAEHVKDKSIRWSDLNYELGKTSSFYYFMGTWNSKVTKHARTNKFFDPTGNEYMSYFSAAVLLLSFLFIIVISILFPKEQFPSIETVINMIILCDIFAVAMIIFVKVSEKSLGRWTPEGMLFYKRWSNFRKYLTDFSLLKEHPPASIKIWDQYMVYAMALGVAEKALDNMSLTVPPEQINTSGIYIMHQNMAIVSGLNHAYHASTPSDSGGSSGGGGGGVGGTGGGFGGGGGGAR